MYNTFFDLKKKPFKLVPNPEFLFLGKCHEEVLAHLHALSEEVRIPCEGVVVIGESFAEVLGKKSASASLVMLGIPDPRELEAGFASHWESPVADLPNVLFVYSAGDMSLHA